MARVDNPPELRARVIALRQGGMTTEAIAKRVGKSRDAVVGICWRAGLRGPQRQAPRPAYRLEFPAAGGCQWIDGDPRQAGARFCGLPVVAGAAWCAGHRARVWAAWCDELQ